MSETTIARLHFYLKNDDERLLSIPYEVLEKSTIALNFPSILNKIKNHQDIVIADKNKMSIVIGMLKSLKPKKKIPRLADIKEMEIDFIIEEGTTDTDDTDDAKKRIKEQLQELKRIITDNFEKRKQCNLVFKNF